MWIDSPFLLSYYSLIVIGVPIWMFDRCLTIVRSLFGFKGILFLSLVDAEMLLSSNI